MVVLVEGAAATLDLRRIQVEALVHLVRVLVALAVDGGKGPAVVQRRVFTGVLDIVHVLAEVNPSFVGTVREEGHPLLHHDVREGEVAQRHAVHIRAVLVFLGQLVVGGCGDHVAARQVAVLCELVVAVRILAVRLGSARIEVDDGEVHVEADSFLPCCEGSCLVAHLPVGLGHVEFHLGRGHQDVVGVVAVEPAALAVNAGRGGVAGGAAAPHVGHGTFGGVLRCGGTYAAAVVAPALDGVDVRHVVVEACVGRTELDHVTGIEVALRQRIVADDLRLGILVAVVRIGRILTRSGFCRDLVAVVVVLGNGTGHHLDSVVCLVAAVEVATVDTPPVVVCGVLCVGSATLTVHAGHVGVGLERCLSVLDQVGCVLRGEVLLVGQGSEVAHDHAVCELQPFVLVTLVDQVAGGQVGAVCVVVFAGEVVDGLLSPFADFFVNDLLRVVVEVQAARLIGLKDRHVAVEFRGGIPGEGLDGVADAGQRPGFFFLGLSDHILEVLAQQPVVDAPHFGSGVGALVVVVVTVVGVDAIEHLGERCGGTRIPVHTLERGEAARKEQARIHVVRSVHVGIHVEILFAAGHHQDRCCDQYSG